MSRYILFVHMLIIDDDSISIYVDCLWIMKDCIRIRRYTITKLFPHIYDDHKP